MIVNRRFGKILLFTLLSFLFLHFFALPTFAQDNYTGEQLTSNLPEDGFFTDIDTSHWGYDVINRFYQDGILYGYPNNEIKPDGFVTRAEVAQLLGRIIENYSELLPEELAQEKEQRNTFFVDVKQEDWFYDSVNLVSSRNLISGYPGNLFLPDEFISREQAMVVATRVINLPLVEVAEQQDEWLRGTKDRGQVSSWAKPRVASVISYQLINGYPGNFLCPKDSISRIEFLSLMYQCLFTELEQLSDYPSYVSPCLIVPKITSRKVFGSRFCELICEIDPLTEKLELWLDGKRVCQKEVDGQQTYSFKNIYLEKRKQVVKVITRFEDQAKESVPTPIYYFPISGSLKRLIVVERSCFRLYWIDDWQVKEEYPVAVGRSSLPTPIREWIVGQKLVHSNNSVFGPRRLRLYKKQGSGYVYTRYGIHGTNRPSSVGTRASHGCIRLYNSDILKLWPKVNIGDRVVTIP